MAGQPATPSGQDHLVKFKSLERGPSLPQEIVASLTSALLAGELRPGDRLPSEQALATEFGVARTVVREAISQLKYDGIVQSRVGVGAFIAQPQERTAFRISPDCFKKRKELLKLLAFAERRRHRGRGGCGAGALQPRRRPHGGHSQGDAGRDRR